jgi:hypothetical protein
MGFTVESRDGKTLSCATVDFRRSDLPGVAVIASGVIFTPANDRGANPDFGWRAGGPGVGVLARFRRRK